MKDIFICADVWYEVFAVVSPLELGQKMALISDRFDALVDVHFKLRKWSLGPLQIRRATDGTGAEIVNKRSRERLPIPQGPMPGNVIGFEWIQISYVDQAVIEFLERICRLFDSSGTNVSMDAVESLSTYSWKIIWQNIWPLVNDNICRLLLSDEEELECLRSDSPAILRNCAKLRLVDCCELFPEFPAEDNDHAYPEQAVAKWLLTAREDGRPNMLNCDWQEMEQLKEAFVNASEAVNFICRLQSYSSGTEPFELENTLTKERLTSRRLEGKMWLLVRCPIVRDEAKWAVWEEEAIEWKWDSEWNCIIIDFKGRDIGDDLKPNESDEGI